MEAPDLAARLNKESVAPSLNPNAKRTKKQQAAKDVSAEHTARACCVISDLFYAVLVL